MTTLCFDFGNTLLKCAVFRNGDIEEIIILETDTENTIDGFISKYHPDKTLLSSVVNHNPVIEEKLKSASKFHLLNHLSKLSITTPVGKPETIGADRLAMVVAAAEMYPGMNTLVIGLGSAITYNFINKGKEFIGGGISPGVGMRFRSLNQFTAKLPLVALDWNFPLMGYDTKTNILSGVVLGTSKEIDGMIDLYREKYLNLNVLLTGGDSGYFAPHLKNKIFADLNLIFKGLYAISELNNV